MTVRLLPFFSFALLCSQTLQRELAPFPVESGGEAVPVPFLGGFNRPVPQFVDWDRDGDVDLFISDEDGRLQFFRNNGSAGMPNFVLESKAFRDVMFGSWFRFADFEGSGFPDLLCQAPGSSDVMLYKNDHLDSLVLLTTRLTDAAGSAVNGGQVVVPATADINGDELADLFVGAVDGTVTYYRNAGLQDGAPVYALETTNFEGISIVWTPRDEVADRHGANALEFFDVEGDGDLDLFWGDLYQPGLFFLENFGTPEDPWIPDSAMVASYPPTDAVQTAGFNVPRFGDLDGDGDGDLLVGVLSGVYGTDYKDNLWFYRNDGAPAAPIFTLVTKNLFETIDLVAGTVPTWGDLDGDVDQDLIVGNEFDPANPGWKGTVHWFRNDGTAQAPALILADSNLFDVYLGNNLAPTFGDLDGDGDLDALVGDWNGKVFLMENIGTATEPEFQYSGNFLGIDLNGRAAPTLGDLDLDGDLDLFVGDKSGYVHYWENVGSPSVYTFVLQTDDLFGGAVGLEVIPQAVDWDGDGTRELLLGTKGGELFVARDIGGSSNVEVVADFPYSGPRIAPAAADVDGDGTVELVVGGQAGGLQFFQIEWEQAGVTRQESADRDWEASLRPNPTNGRFVVELAASKGPLVFTITVTDLLGREVVAPIETRTQSGTGKHSIPIEVDQISSGAYLCRVRSSEGRERILRAVVLR